MTNPTTKTSHHISLVTLYILLLYSLLFNSTMAKSSTYNVVDFGAKPNGKTDSTKSFLIAWNKVCTSNKPSIIYVPHGKFLLGRVTFSGELCVNKNISLIIDGTLVAPSDYNFIGEASYWLMFEKVSGVSIHGGVLDGKGNSLWDCKNSEKSCPIGAAVCNN
jgi:polygalacturonase